MTTRNELIEKVDRLTSDYLGWETQVAGMSSKNKADLERAAARLERAINARNQAQALQKKYTRQAWDAVSIFPKSFEGYPQGEAILEDFRQANLALQEASFYWADPFGRTDWRA